MIEEYQTCLIPWNSLFTESMSLQLRFQAYVLTGAAVTQSKRDIKRLSTVLCCTKIPSMCWALARVFLPSRNSWRKSPRHSCLADFSMRTRQWLPSAPPRLDCTTRGRGKRCVHSVWSQGGSDIWTNVRNIFKENAFLMFILRPFNNAGTIGLWDPRKRQINHKIWMLLASMEGAPLEFQKAIYIFAHYLLDCRRRGRAWMIGMRECAHTCAICRSALYTDNDVRWSSSSWREMESMQHPRARRQQHLRT